MSAGARRLAPKRDMVEAAIVTTLRRAGCHVTRLSGAGIPDLLISRAGRWHLAEIKAANGRLTPAQREFHGSARATVAVLRSVDDAIEWTRRS